MGRLLPNLHSVKISLNLIILMIHSIVYGLHSNWLQIWFDQSIHVMTSGSCLLLESAVSHAWLPLEQLHSWRCRMTVCTSQHFIILPSLSAESPDVFPESFSQKLTLDHPSLLVWGTSTTLEQQGPPEFWYVHCTDLDHRAVCPNQWKNSGIQIWVFQRNWSFVSRNRS